MLGFLSRWFIHNTAECILPFLLPHHVSFIHLIQKCSVLEGQNNYPLLWLELVFSVSFWTWHCLDWLERMNWSFLHSQWYRKQLSPWASLFTYQPAVVGELTNAILDYSSQLWWNCASLFRPVLCCTMVKATNKNRPPVKSCGGNKCIHFLQVFFPALAYASYSEAGFSHSCPSSLVQQHGVNINAVCSRADGMGNRAAEGGCSLTSRTWYVLLAVVCCFPFWV